MVSFNVATNFDQQQLEGIVALNQACLTAPVASVYGSFPFSSTGSGRSPIGLPFLTPDYLAGYIAKLHQHGIEYIHLMNAPHPHLDRRDLKAQFYREVSDLVAMGIDAVTLANADLIRDVHNTFPDISIRASVILAVDTPGKAVALAQSGVRVIALNQFTSNRDLERITTIADSVKPYGTEIELYANISCLAGCVRAQDHYAYLGRMSQKGVPNKPRIDPYKLWCMNEFLADPIQLLKAPFVRPEAIPLYAAQGITHFKLSDRLERTDPLLQRTEAYQRGEFHGNLFPLLFRDRGEKWSGAVRGIVDLPTLGLPAICIDNDVLTQLDFDHSVTSLREAELEEFYCEAARRAVSGVDVPETIQFKMAIEKAAHTEATPTLGKRDL